MDKSTEDLIKCQSWANHLTRLNESYWEYIKILREMGEIVCSDCGGELSLAELKDNYKEPLCDSCVRALKD